MATTGNKTNFTIKMDRETRNAFDLLCKNIGISMSAGINALVKQAVREQGMSFSLRDQNGFILNHAAALKRRAAEVDAGLVENHDLIEG